MDLLKKLNAYIEESQDPNRENIDICIREISSDMPMAWIWGEDEDSLDIECNHFDIEYEDDETKGECLLCGALCDWHYEDDVIEIEDDYQTIQDRVPDEWHYENINLKKLYQQLIK